RADGNVQRLRRLAILQVLEIDQVNDITKGLRKLLDGLVQPGPPFVGVQLSRRRQLPTGQQIEQLADVFAVGTRRAVEADHAMPPAAALRVDRLVGGDRVEPGADRPSRLKLLALQVYLEERRLKGILCHFRVAQVPPQVAK